MEDMEIGLQIPRVYISTRRENIEVDTPMPRFRIPGLPTRRDDMGKDLTRQVAHVRRHSTTIPRGRESVFPIIPLQLQAASSRPEELPAWFHLRNGSKYDPVMNWASTLAVGETASRISMDCAALSTTLLRQPKTLTVPI